MILIMGVLNVTPDSFSDGGRWYDADAAIAQGRLLVEEGADIVDVGGESSRPGAQPVSEEEELRRILPVVTEMARVGRVSVDTRKRSVAEAALGAGASIVNDTTGTLWSVAVEGRAGWVAMHCPAEPAVMARHTEYRDVVIDVCDDLVAKASTARAGGVEEIWIDPGIGFAKTAQQNLILLRHLDRLVGTGWPVAVGTSRKSFLGALAPAPDGAPAPVDDRLEGSLTTVAWAMSQGVSMVRVHDVRQTHALRQLAGRDPGPVADGRRTVSVAGVQS